MHQSISQDMLSSEDIAILVPLAKTRSVYFLIKDSFDVLIALLALVLLSPFMALVALLIVLDTPGSAFFVQKRVGARLIKSGKHCYWQQVEFPCYKFRTMAQDTDPSLHQAFMKAYIQHENSDKEVEKDADTKVYKLVQDPRVTRLGRFLRKASIDELPQFWNILRGDMSLVGPRPAIPYELDLYSPWHFQRLQAKPGITGLWQVTARSSVEFDEMVALDIEYIRKQSFWLDLKILLKTPFAVLSCKGAQ
jgi:lipopolysaccharide/colanic/teichoic acid biosynthesis glycosyltransferase